MSDFGFGKFGQFPHYCRTLDIVPKPMDWALCVNIERNSNGKEKPNIERRTKKCGKDGGYGCKILEKQINKIPHNPKEI